MFYFTSRAKARVFAKLKGLIVTDRGADAEKRWAVQVVTG